jgi:hypothetical protein
MRRSRRTSIGFRALLIGIGLPIIVAFALFSLMPYEVMTGKWPLGISPREVEIFQQVCDHRPGQLLVDRTERYDLDSAGAAADPADAEWHHRRFNAPGYADSARVRRTLSVDGGWVIDFPEERLFRSQRRIRLLPAGMASIRNRYAQLVASEIGAVTPEIGFIRLFSSGRDLGVFVKEEIITNEFLEKKGLTETALMGEPSNLGGPGIEAQRLAEEGTLRAALSGDTGRIDGARLATLALLRCALDVPSTETPVLVFDRSKSRLTPIHQLQVAKGEELFAQAKDQERIGLFATADNHQRVFALAAKIRADSAQWVERFAAVEAEWAPALAQGASSAFVQARLVSERNAFMQALFHPDPVKAFGTAEHSGDAERTERVVDPWLAPHVRGDSAVFERGVYTIDHDITMPQGMTLVLGKGVRFFLAPGKSLLVNGPFYAQGTGVNPVFIRPVDPVAPYGVIAVHGNGRTPCKLNGVRMSGGSTAWLADRYHSGMLTFLDCHVSASNCEISGSLGEDAMNVKRGEVRLEDCVFSEGADDLLDLDVCKGAVQKCVFLGRVAGDSTATNGDGLDVSGSTILVRECRFEGLRDKGLSVGEASQVFAQGCTFQNNTLAMAIKDLSVAHADGNTFIGNRTVFSVFRKKPVFGGGQLTVYSNVLEGNAQARSMDAVSKITDATRVDEKVRKLFGL